MLEFVAQSFEADSFESALPVLCQGSFDIVLMVRKKKQVKKAIAALEEEEGAGRQFEINNENVPSVGKVRGFALRGIHLCSHYIHHPACVSLLVREAILHGQCDTVW